MTIESSRTDNESAALRFIEVPYNENAFGNLLLQFPEQGYVILRDVFEPDSVDLYREQILARVEPTGTPANPYRLRMDDALVLAPARAPRLLAVMRAAFMPWADQPLPVLRHPAWLIKPSNPGSDVIVNDWHKDADFLGTTTRQGYSCPQEITTAIYLEDMTPEHGPTYAIPRSHRDPSLSPHGGADGARSPQSHRHGRNARGARALRRPLRELKIGTWRLKCRIHCL